MAERHDWHAEMKQAAREMRKSKAAIEASPRGTPSAKNASWTRKPKKPRGPVS